MERDTRSGRWSWRMCWGVNDQHEKNMALISKKTSQL
jgi:hypothetical protein